jgi:predicted DNA-binding transcriptional regulator AlpA
MKPTITEPQLLTTAQVCERFQITRDTLQRWVRLGIAPRPFVIGPRCYRWRLAEIKMMEQRGGGLEAAERFAKNCRAAFWRPESDEPGQRTEIISDEIENPENEV